MSYTRLIISGSEVAITQDIPVTINFSISDVREPDKRNSAYSKTITLPGTKETNQLFEMIFDVNAQQTNFNPNIKTSCEYWVGNQRVFYGDLQLLKIIKRGLHPSVDIRYEVSIVGQLANIFIGLGNAMLHDLDMSDLDHAFDYFNQYGLPATTQPTLGQGYVYCLADYGVSGGNSQNWETAHLKPAIFFLEYWNRIFAYAGKTYISPSGFFATDYVKRLVIPDVNEGALKKDPQDVYDNSFYAGKTGTTTHTLNGLYSFSGWIYAGSPTQFLFNSVFDEDTAAPFHDTGNHYDTSTNTWTITQDNTYNSLAQLNYEIRIVPPAGTVSFSIVGTNYTFASVNAGSSDGVSVAPNISGWVDMNMAPMINGVLLLNGVTAQIQVSANDSFQFATKFFNVLGIEITSGTSSIEIREKDTCTWYGMFAQDLIANMDNVVMNNTIPRDYKMVDFITSFLKMENLYMELDPNDNNNYIIEPREIFFIKDLNQVKDYTDKLDISQDIEISPMGDLDWRKYIFSYKSDGDKFNKQYFDEFQEVYGTEQVDVDNDFIRDEKKTELIFSASPLVGNNDNTIVAPVFAAEDGTAIKPMKCNIRILYYGGLLPCTPYNQLIFGAPNAQTTYSYMGHVDDPANPTIDLCWDNPRKLYFTYVNQTYTNNGLYNRNYSKFIEEITDPGSKIITAKFHLLHYDIATFTFRKIIKVDDAYYYVNSISDYNPNEPSVCTMELLYIKPGTDFVPLQFGMILDGQMYGMDFPGIVNPKGLQQEYGGLTLGSNNIGRNGALVIGENNFVGGDNL